MASTRPGGGAPMDNLPDFFRLPVDASDVSSALEPVPGFSDDWDIPLTGLPGLDEGLIHPHTQTDAHALKGEGGADILGGAHISSENVDLGLRGPGGRAAAPPRSRVVDELAAITGEATHDGSWESEAALAAQIQSWQRDRVKAAAAAAETFNDPALLSVVSLAVGDDEEATAPAAPQAAPTVAAPEKAAPPAPALAAAPTSGTLSLAELEASMLAGATATTPAPKTAAAPGVPAPGPGAHMPPQGGAQMPPPGWVPPMQGGFPGMPGVPMPGGPPMPGMMPPRMMPGMLPHRPTILPPAVVQGMHAQLQQIFAIAARTPGGILAAPPHIRQQAQFLQASLMAHAAAVQAAAAGMAAGIVPGMPGGMPGFPGGAPGTGPRPPMAGPAPPLPPGPAPAPGGAADKAEEGAGRAGPRSYAQASGGTSAGHRGGRTDKQAAHVTATAPEEAPRILARPQHYPPAPAAQPGAPRGPAPGAAGPGPVYVAPGARPMSVRPAQRAPVTMASVLSHPIPGGVRGSRMSRADILTVARMMYTNIAAAGDPFAECYYHFALQAKRAATAAAGPMAPHAPSGPAGSPTTQNVQGNVLDVAAVLTSIGNVAIASSRAGGQKGAGKSTSSSTATVAPTTVASTTSEAETPADVAAAAAVIATLPMVSVAQRNKARDLTEQRNDLLARRRLWEQHSKVLGRVMTSSVRAPKQMLTLSASGRTRASDIDHGTVKQSLSGADVRRTAKQQSSAAAAEGATAEPAAEEAVTAQPPAVERDPEIESLWLARAHIEDASEAVLALQEAARRLQAHLRVFPPPSAEVMLALRTNVARRRATLARFLGLRKLPPVSPPANQDETKKEDGASYVPLTVLPKLNPSDSIHDEVVLAILSMSKGKRLFARAVPMLHAADRAAAIAAGMRHLPHFVASAAVGKEAEDADALLAAALATWVKDYSAAADLPADSPSPRALLAALNIWMNELHTAHTGAIIRALLQHPGASEVISAALFRGEAEAERLSAAQPAAEGEAPAAAPNADVQAWREITESLGRAFVESA